MPAHQPVHVAVRVRPFSDRAGPGCVEWSDKTGRILVRDHVSASLAKSFEADELLSETTTNKVVFEKVCRGILDSAIASPAGPLSSPIVSQAGADTLCFFAYGHTNSGKTHTIAGSPSDSGLLTRCAMHLLRAFGSVDVTMLEVYNERVFDLLAHGAERRVRRQQQQTRTGSSSYAATFTAGAVVVEGLETCTVRSPDEWLLVVAFGLAQRRTGPNEHNSRSSRSHALFTLKACGRSVCLVDLAGSERQTAFTKSLEKDSILINKSLSRLSTVVEALSRRKKGVTTTTTAAASTTSPSAAVGGSTGFVNFRDTVLTVLLQRYLEGSSVTTFIACIHPAQSFYQETLSTMRYTARLKHVTTLAGPTPAGFLRERHPNAAEHRELVDELTRLRQQLQRQHETSSEVHTLQRQRIEELERQSLLYHRTMSNTSVESSCSVDSVTGRSARDTRRVTSWLLSRCQASMPSFSVSFGDYFDSMFPTMDVVGYVSSMAMLPPVDLEDPSVARCFLDTGDVAMGLLMLDAGIPPLVHVHRSSCHEIDHWDTPEWAEREVFVLAVFEVDAAELDELRDEDGPPPCCGGALSCNALVPFAVVFGSRPGAAGARAALRQHLESLAQHSASSSGPYLEVHVDPTYEVKENVLLSNARQPSPVIQAAYPPTLHDDDQRSQTPLIPEPPTERRFFGSLLEEVLEQARRSISQDGQEQHRLKRDHEPGDELRNDPQKKGGDLKNRHQHQQGHSSHQLVGASATVSDLGDDSDAVAEAAVVPSVSFAQERDDVSTVVFDDSCTAIAAGNNLPTQEDEQEVEEELHSSVSSTIFFVDDPPPFQENVSSLGAEEAVGKTSIDVKPAIVTMMASQTPEQPSALSIFAVSAMTSQQLHLSALPSRASSATVTTEEIEVAGCDHDDDHHHDDDSRHQETGWRAAKNKQHLCGLRHHHETVPSTAEDLFSLPPSSPVDLTGTMTGPTPCDHPNPRGGGVFCSVAVSQDDVPRRPSPLPLVVERATSDAVAGPTQLRVAHEASFLAFRAVVSSPTNVHHSSPHTPKPRYPHLQPPGSSTLVNPGSTPRRRGNNNNGENIDDCDSAARAPCEPFGASTGSRGASCPSTAGESSSCEPKRSASPLQTAEPLVTVMQARAHNRDDRSSAPKGNLIASSEVSERTQALSGLEKDNNHNRKERDVEAVQCTPQCQACSIM
jgi:hypothetical protein